jgi:tyrosine-specific transport protein
MFGRFIGSIAIIISTVVGAGIFGLPYVVMKSGYWVGISYLLVLGFTSVLISLLYGEVVLRTSDHHQLPGYAKHYLGQTGKEIASLSFILGFYGALVAYMIGVANFAKIFFGDVFGANSEWLYGLIFWLIACAVIYLGLKWITRWESVMIFVLLAVIFAVTVVALPKMNLANLFVPAERWQDLFLPYGVVLFALAGSSSVPVVFLLLRDKGRDLKKIIIIGMLLPLALYLIFVTVVVGVSGVGTTETALGGLVDKLGVWVISFGALFGMLAMGNAFLTLSFTLREMYSFDYNFSRRNSLAVVLGIPLVLYLFGVHDFIYVLALAGSFLGGVEGIIVVLLHYRARKLGTRKPEYVIHLSWLGRGLLITLFVLGLFYQVWMIV